MFLQVGNSYGFAPVEIDRIGWCVLMYENKEDFEKDNYILNFILDLEHISNFKNAWIIATEIKQQCMKINNDVNEWLKPKKHTQSINYYDGKYWQD